MSSVYAVIMAGGKGERFWPLSTSTTPKQLLDLFGEKPLMTAAARSGLLRLDAGLKNLTKPAQP